METHSALPIRLQPSNLRPIAYRILSKKHGLNIQTDALQLLTETVSYRYGLEWKGSQSQMFLEDIAKVWKSQDRGIFIDRAGLKQVVKELSSKEGKKRSERSERSDQGSGRFEGSDVQKAGRSDTVVDTVVDEVGEKEKEAEQEQLDEFDWKDYFQFINPDKQPNYVFDNQRKQFGLASSKPHGKLAVNLPSTIAYFNRRYNLIRDRLSRNSNFQKPSFSSISSLHKSVNNQISEITLIKNVLGRDGSRFLLFGLLSKNSNDDYILEDSTDFIELNLAQAHKTEGSFYCPGMFVIVEGIYSASGGSMSNLNVISGCFYVSNIGHPPAERRDRSMENYGNIDLLGINRAQHNDFANHILRIDKTLKRQLSSYEKSLVNTKIVIAGSECYLDDFKVLDGLKKFFGKLENLIIEDAANTPLALVLIGSFTSKPLSYTTSSIEAISNSENYKNNFDNLSSILAKYPYMVQNVKLVLIPGINDPWQSMYSLGSSNANVFPQKSVPKIFLNRLERLLPKGNLVLAWNPARMTYLTQELVFLKDNLFTKFKRNDIVFASDLEAENAKLEREKMSPDGQIRLEDINTDNVHISTRIKLARKLVKTLLDQGTLQPFLPNLKVINSHYDYALRIEPLPSLLILSDSDFPNFEVTYNGCKVINITRLQNVGRKLNYVEYHPAHKKFEFEEIYF